MAYEEKGIAIRDQVYSCEAGALITEEAEHLEYGVKANFYNEGIRLTQLSSYFIEHGTLLVPHQELDSLLSIFKLWEQHHESLPGSKAQGHSWCGWLYTEYFNPCEARPAFTEHNSKSSVGSVVEKSAKNNPGQVMEWKQKTEKAEEHLNEKLKNKLSTKTLEAKISRFELELKYKEGGTTALLTEYDIAAIRDFVPFYRKRRNTYS